MPLRDIQKPRRILRLYHGSPITNISKFDIAYSRESFLDFGKGIYFTTSEEQASVLFSSADRAIPIMPMVTAEIKKG